MKGLVMRTTGSWYRVLPEGGTTDEAVDCRLRGNYRLRGNKQTNPVAVGDWVEYAMQDDGTGVIADVCDRRNYIVRRATKLSKQTHVIAANVDRLCIVASLAFPRMSTGFIDRLLVTAEAYHIPASIIFNKTDLYDQGLAELHSELESIYASAGYKVYGTSALRGDGVEELRDLMSGRTTLFSGHSGVGKSALVKALDPSLNVRIGEISDYHEKGKHTTTFAEMHHLGFGAWIVDTPGIKEFVLYDLEKETLAQRFPEMRNLMSECRFANCTHTHEPGCAVKAAVENGDIADWRYVNYIRMMTDESHESVKEEGL